MRGARTWCRSLAICAFVLGLAAIAAPGYAQTGQVKGKVVDATASRSTAPPSSSRAGTRRPQLQVKTNKNGRIHPDRPPARPVQDHRDEGRLTQTLDQASAWTWWRSTSALKPGGGGGEASAEDARRPKPRMPRSRGVRRRRRAQQRRQARRGNRQVQRGDRRWRRTASTASPTSAPRTRRRRTREGRGSVQEGDRAEAGLRRGLQRARERLQRAEEVRPGGRGQREGDEASARRRGRRRGGGGNAEAMFNQGVILWNAGKIAEAKVQFEDAVKAESEATPRRTTSSGMAHAQRRQACAERGAAFENYLKLAPTGQYAEQAKGSSTTSRSSGSVRAIADQPRRASAPASPRAARPVRRIPPPSARRRLQDLRHRRHPRRRRRRPARFRREPRPGSPAEDRRRRPTLPIQWHLIGHLQSNKAQEGRAGVRRASTRSIARPAARSSTRRRPTAGATARILVQVDLAGEATKFGAPPDEAERIVRAAALGCARVGSSG